MIACQSKTLFIVMSVTYLFAPFMKVICSTDSTAVGSTKREVWLYIYAEK